MLRILFIPFIIFVVGDSVAEFLGGSSNQIQPLKRIYLHQSKDQYNLGVDFNENVKFFPRIHSSASDISLILSFNRNIVAPPPKLINHPVVKSIEFARFGPSSLMMIIKFANYLTITQKRYTKHDLHIGFKVRRKPMIIIDPGHGGRDLGTQSISGSYEKNITLVMAIELMQNLLDSGRYNVFLTRDGDFNVSMDKRRKIFCKKHGDLLISLHTNGGSTARMRGISVYTLPTLGFSQKLCDTSNIDGTKCHKNLHMSHRFAEALTDYIPNVCKLHRHTHGNNNLKILEIDKPAVLISCGNLSDRRDNNLLHSKKFRDRTNKAILYALDKFFGRENK